MIIYFDIETIPLPPGEREFTKPKFENMEFGSTKDEGKKRIKFEEEVSKWEEGSKAALSSLENQIVLAGSAIGDGDYSFIIGDDGNEQNLIKSCLDLLGNQRGITQIVGHNIGFDLRNIIRKGWKYQINVPGWLIDELNRYKSNVIFDTMKQWQLNDRSDYVTLEYLAAFFGAPQNKIKDSSGDIVTGAKFYKSWAIDREACIQYNREDIVSLRHVHKFLR